MNQQLINSDASELGGDVASELSPFNSDAPTFTAGDLEKLELPNLPTSDRGIREYAKRKGWPYVKVPGRGPDGMEMRFTPPPEVMALIEARMRGELPPQSPIYKPGRSSSPLVASESDHQPVDTDGFVYVPYFDVRASAGHGAFVANRPAVRHYAFDRQWLALHVGVPPTRLALIPVSGNSMEPDLVDGDLVMIDRGDIEVLREGVYVFEVDDGLFVKRLRLSGDRLVIESSNHQDYPPREVSLMRENPSFRLHGRVIGSPTFKRL